MGALSYSQREENKNTRRCRKCAHCISIHTVFANKGFCCEGTSFESAGCFCNEQDFDCLEQLIYDGRQ